MPITGYSCIPKGVSAPLVRDVYFVFTSLLNFISQVSRASMSSRLYVGGSLNANLLYWINNVNLAFCPITILILFCSLHRSFVSPIYVFKLREVRQVTHFRGI